ncbi:SKP1-like protein 18 [Acorus calamus]|uniref:SKP1-like protein 18 n=1 Tax=Acorus calamus TaxID=4465 RepID=A0AAV9F3W2_ACOCL|nr:SKP1-like protein 18 [Acorus calamus]
MKKWDEEYINVSAEDLFHILMVANYLDIEGLLGLAAQQAENLIKGKKVEDIRGMFGITNDYTAEEEEKLHEKNALGISIMITIF